MKKFFVLICLSLLFFVLASPSVYAQYPNESPTTNGQNRDDAATDPNGQAVTANFFQASLYEPVCLGIGIACSNSSEGQTKGFQTSVMGVTSQTIATLYNHQPANLALWFRDTGETLGFIPKSAYAQGVGFEGLRPLIDLWKVFRNIAYMLLSIMMVFVGFMVMFRRKIDPKTVVTVQNALPRVIVALIAITFSYAIVAFLIEIMYIIIFAAITLLAPYTSNPTLTPENAINSYINGGFGELWNNVYGSTGALNLGDIAIGNNIFEQILSFIKSLDDILTNVLIWVFIAIALLFSIFRIFFMLINAYIQVLISLITGPIQILVDVIPGTNALQGWLIGLVGNLSTFALTSILLLISRVLMDQIQTQNLWSAPFMGGIGSNILTAVLVCGFMIMIPSIIAGLKEKLKSNFLIPLSAGSAFSPVGGALQMGMSTLSQYYYGKQTIGPLLGMFNKNKGKDPHNP